MAKKNKYFDQNMWRLKVNSSDLSFLAVLISFKRNLKSTNNAINW